MKNLVYTDEYTDGDYIYYVAAISGRDKWAICKKAIGWQGVGLHKYRAKDNAISPTWEKSYGILKALAKKKGWRPYRQVRG